MVVRFGTNILSRTITRRYSENQQLLNIVCTMVVPTKSLTVQSTILYDYAHTTYSTKNNDIVTEIVQVIVKITSKLLVQSNKFISMTKEKKIEIKINIVTCTSIIKNV